MKLESDHVQVICDSAQDYYFILLPASTHQYILLFTSFLTHKTTTTTHNIFSLVNLSHHDHAISHIKSHPKRGFTIETIFPYLWLPMVNMKTSPNRTSTSTTTLLEAKARPDLYLSVWSFKTGFTICHSNNCS